MLFHTLDFAAFFGVVVLLYGLLRGPWLLMALTGASYFFYGYIQPYYVVLLFLLTLSDYVIGLVAGRFKARWHGVLVSFVVNFGTLAYFKYANFGLENARAALELLGLSVEMPRIDVVLPIGISFHIFQSFAYVMDVLDGRIAPCRSFVRYALYVSWFPQLVAGPIERPGHLLPQLAAIGETKAGFPPACPRGGAVRRGLDPHDGRRRALPDRGRASTLPRAPRPPTRCSGSSPSGCRSTATSAGTAAWPRGPATPWGSA